MPSSYDLPLPSRLSVLETKEVNFVNIRERGSGRKVYIPTQCLVIRIFICPTIDAFVPGMCPTGVDTHLYINTLKVPHQKTPRRSIKSIDDPCVHLRKFDSLPHPLLELELGPRRTAGGSRKDAGCIPFRFAFGLVN